MADERDDDHRPPPGTSEQTVDAVGALTAAFEVVEHARGMLYAFHRLTGRADKELAEALDQLAEAGHQDLADELRAELVGRNVLPGRWTFQVVEAYDEEYYRVFEAAEQRVCDELMAGRRHVYEAGLKEQNRTHGRPGHEPTPEA
ncbi:hypothetical protein [Cellulomonas terrae]|uniref:Uncharacterized protein n=1 Tax=Cellulomonas terrae TaxID=311234 RepID=A0A511JM23_9CELL|nr:hypothetical protein [Cellulomonas terrae]GEL98935.1 hypothetical protein CTE05_24820 [Cellulomonas terrae]